MQTVGEDGEKLEYQQNYNATIYKHRIRPLQAYFDMIDALCDNEMALTSVQFTSPVGLGLAGLIGAGLGSAFTLHFMLLIWSMFVSTEPDEYARVGLLNSWGIYGCALSFYHMSEFVLTMRYNASIASCKSYLLDQSRAYVIAMLVSWVEFWIEYTVMPKTKYRPWLAFVGIVMVVVGQTFRSGAMANAKSNFSHMIQSEKRKQHQLVTTGFYRIVRHPSYFGWFWWSIGTQCLLCNPICIVAYAAAAWKFFSDRIPAEELYLVKFFGDSYEEYRKRTFTGIPGVA